MLVLVYRKCSTCQKALKWLEEHKIFFEERAIVDENPTYEELKEWYGKSGLPLKKFFNTSGMLYKQMNLKDKLPEMTEDEQLRLLATDGMLVKRPLVIGEDFVLTGFREKEWEEKIRGCRMISLKLVHCIIDISLNNLPVFPSNCVDFAQRCHRIASFSRLVDEKTFCVI